MAISSRIVFAAQSFNQNAIFLKQTVDGLTDNEWLRRPGEHANHLLWIVGHIAWACTMLQTRLGAEWTTPWMSLYARGAKCVDLSEGPTPKMALQAWDEACTRLNAGHGSSF